MEDKAALVGQAEEVHGSSMRGVGRTRPAGKAKEKEPEEKKNLKASEDLETKGHSRTRRR